MEFSGSNLTEGGILKKLLMVALPIMGTQFMLMAYNLTDMFWLGHTKYAVVAVAASGLGGMYLWLADAFMHIGRTGAEIGTAQNLGRGEPEAAKAFAEDALRISLILGVGCGILLVVFAGPLIKLLQVTEGMLYDNAKVYLQIVGAVTPFFFMSSAITGIFIGAGNSKISFRANAVGLILNMILDPIMILYLGWGVVGAAIATSIAEVTVCVLLIVFLKHKRITPLAGIKILGARGSGSAAGSGSSKQGGDRGMSRADWATGTDGTTGADRARGISPADNGDPSLGGPSRTKTIFIWGAPLAVESAAFTILSMVVTAMAAAWYGEMAVAVNRVGVQIESLSWMVGMGFSSAMTAFVGQNFGAEKWDRIKRSFKIATVTLLGWEVFVTILMVAFGGFFFSLFLREPPEIVDMGAVYLKIMALSLVFMAFEGVCSGAFRGLGKTLPPSICSIGANLLRPLLCWLLSIKFGMNGLWLGLSISAMLRGLSMLIWYLYEENNLHT